MPPLFSIPKTIAKMAVSLTYSDFAKGFYGAPSQPSEDLALYSEDASLLLDSIGHEYDAWLVLDDGEKQELTAHFAHVKQAAPPQIALGADRITIAGGVGTLLTFARRLREPPTPGVLVLPRIDDATAASRRRRHRPPAACPGRFRTRFRSSGVCPRPGRRGIVRRVVVHVLGGRGVARRVEVPVSGGRGIVRGVPVESAVKERVNS